MIHSFSGDPFLTTRAARSLLRQLRAKVGEFTELGEQLTPEAVQSVASQTGLFGAGGLYLDLDAAFSGQAGIKPRNALLKLLPQLPAELTVIAVDSTATEARQKQWRSFSEHRNLPTPRFQALERWVASELDSADLTWQRGVPALMVQLFGEDLPAIASEISKFTHQDAELTSELVRTLTGKESVTDAFALIDAIVAGDPAEALRQCRALELQDEDGVKVLAAVAWQFALVARCVALLEEEPGVRDAQVASRLGQRPFVAGKVLKIASRLSERSLRPLLAAIAAADLASKSGLNPDWALERLAIEASGMLAR